MLKKRNAVEKWVGNIGRLHRRESTNGQKIN